MQALNDYGYRVIPMSDYLDFALHNKPVPDNAVVITFDDGYESFYTHAYPALKRFGMTATNFIIGISSDLYNSDAYPHLNWAQMRELKKNGMSIFSHTYNLHQMLPIDKEGNLGPALTNQIYLQQKDRLETEKEYIRRIETDLRFMNKRLEQELDEQPKLLAFPFGYYNETVLKVGRKLGIELFFTTDEGINDRHTREVFRINAGEPTITAEDLIGKMKQYY